MGGTVDDGTVGQLDTVLAEVLFPGVEDGLVLDLEGAPARRLESYVAWRARHFGLPYGDQGLLVARAFYERLGGFAEIPIMEDIDMIRRARRAGGGRPEMLDITATTSARRYRGAGVVLRGARNLFCLALYFLGVPPRMIVRLYG